MVVRELVTRLGFSLNNAQVSNAEKATQRLKSQANEASTAFRNIIAGFASFSAVRGISRVSDEMQGMRTRIGMLPQTIGEAGTAFDMVAQHATDAGQSIEAYGTLYARLGNSAKDYIKTQDDLLQVTDTISKALVVGGANAQESSSVMIQFAQALGSGVLQGDEFRAMAEAAPQYLDKLSEAMGIPREQLKKMASEGKLTSRAVIAATQTMADYFDDRFKQMPMGPARAMIIISNRFSRGLDRMNRATGLVTTIANFMIAAFDRIEAGVAVVVKAFGGWENLIRFLGIAIGVAFGAKAISILIAFGAAGAAALIQFTLIAAAIALVAATLEDLYVWIQGGDSSIGNMIGPWTEWSEYVLGAINVVINTFRLLGEIIGALGAAIVGIFTFDFALFKEGVKGLTAHIGRALGFSADVTGLAPTANMVGPAQMVGGPMGGNMVGPAQMVGGPMGGNSPQVQSNTTVKVTVPAGTTAEQAAFLDRAAQESFGKQSDGQLARVLSVYAP